MAITRALLPKQLHAGAPDLRLTGDQRNRGTYTQRRRNQMADGGIASMRDRIKYNVRPGETLVGKPGGLVEPGVKQYGLLSKAWDKFKDDIIPNEIKENPMITALAGGALLNQFGLPGFITEPLSLSEKAGQNWLGDLLNMDLVLGDTGQFTKGSEWDLINNPIGNLGNLTKGENPFILGGGIGGAGTDDFNWPFASTTGTLGDIASTVKGGLTNFLDPNYYLGKIGLQTANNTAYNADGTPKVRWMEPLAIGTAIGAADAATRKDHQLPEDLSINIPKTAQAAMDDPNLRFKPPLEATQLAADGGRIGYEKAGIVGMMPAPSPKPASEMELQTREGNAVPEYYDYFKDISSEPTFVMPKGSDERADLNEVLYMGDNDMIKAEQIVDKKAFDKIYKEALEIVKDNDEANKYFLNLVNNKDLDISAIDAYYSVIKKFGKNKAEGGRIGYEKAGPVDLDRLPFKLPFNFDGIPVPNNYLRQLEEFLKRKEEYEDRIKRAPKQEAAQGGRIGYAKGLGPVLDPPEDNLTTLEFMQDQGIPHGQMAEFKPVGIEELVDPIYKKLREQGMSHEEAVKEIFKMLQGKARGEKSGIMMASDPGFGDGPFMFDEFLEAVKKGYKGTYEDYIDDIDRSPADYMGAKGGRVPAQEGGLMDLGGMEKDYRQEGGFVPIGGEEKADDVPARLSKNEFVFTADAVRSAGGGDIDEGAAVMERLMENLEAGGKVSEESQGLEGAREMFATTQRLEKRIA